MVKAAGPKREPDIIRQGAGARLALWRWGLPHDLRVKPPGVAKLEQRTDVCISSLRSHIESTGGQLRIAASSPINDVAITIFSSVS